ncbi:MAG: AAA family ATPase [Gammaproteobacteria bacterium]|nr:AAA family ATPase [Gammaproteobacteria bacterium]
MKLQRKLQERFFSCVFELRPLIEALNIEALDGYWEGSFEKIVRQPACSYADYSRSLVAQVLAEVQNCIVEKLRLITASTDTPLLLKKGLTIKNNNVRFFSGVSDLVAGKYALLFIDKTTKARRFFVADYDGIKTFQIGFKTDSSAITLVNAAAAYNVHILASLTPYFRSFIAACQPETDILQALAAGRIDTYFPGGLAQAVIHPGLNPSQSQALFSFTRLKRGIQVMKGPPGTGKTTTIVETIFIEYQQLVLEGKKEPILVSGPSNKSVSVIAHSFRKKHPQVKVVLCEREPISDDMIESLVENEIKNVDIIFATLSKSGSAVITKAIKKIRALIIDEAGQASEPDMQIPFQLNPDKVLLVGDECQLPPTVLCKNPEQFNYHWSILTRLIIECCQPYFLLDTQYRMHPRISLFPRKDFYGNQVKDGVSEDERASKGEIAPYQVLDVVDGVEELDPVLKSYKNIREAYAVIEQIRHVLLQGYQVSDLSVITPYKAQAKLLQDLVARELNITSLTINTIDSFQGEESPVVFVSMVRANALGRIGFAKDFRRLNVAITRPREVLRILLNGTTFNPFHPKNELQSSMLDIFLKFSEIPLPGMREEYFDKRDPKPKYADDPWDDSEIFYSTNGYRSSLQDYCDRRGAIKGPEPIKRFSQFLEQYQERTPSAIGKFPIFFLPTLPKKTHIIQDILDQVKIWKNLSFSGLPDDVFAPFCYSTLEEVRYTHEGYDYGDRETEEGTFYWDENVDEQEVETRPIIFENHLFFRCDLSNLNFHNSRFINTTFFQCKVEGCQVNLDRMDEVSKASFLANRGELAVSRESLPTDRLVFDAMRRDLYLPFFDRKPADEAVARTSNLSAK